MNNLRSFLPEDWKLLLSAFGSAYGVGLLTFTALPFFISAFMHDLSVNASHAGFIVSAEFTFTMLAAIIAAPFMGSAPRRSLALAGAVIVFSASLASAQVTDIYWLVAIRCISGAGAGLCLACGNASVSNSRSPDKLAGHMNILFCILLAILMILLSRVMAAYGLSGLYYALSATSGLMLLLIAFMPQGPSRNANPPESSHGVTRRKLSSSTAVCMMAAMFFFSMRDTMGWAFVEQVGVHIGYSGEALGDLMSIQSMLALLGPLAAAIIGKKFGMTLPVIFGVLICGAVSLGYLLAPTKEIYLGSVMLLSITYSYTLTYLTALAAQLDKEGRIVAASGSFLTFGIAVGPIFTGLLAEAGGFSLVGCGVAGAILLTLIFVIAPLTTVRRIFSKSADMPPLVNNRDSSTPLFPN